MASPGDSDQQVSEIYPGVIYPQQPPQGTAPTVEQRLQSAWLQGMQFIDPNHSTGQQYPGFELAPPIDSAGA